MVPAESSNISRNPLLVGLLVELVKYKEDANKKEMVTGD